MSRARAVLAVDVGGTSIKAGLVDRTGVTLRQASRPTPVRAGPDAVVAAVRATAAEFVGDASAVGVVVPGAVDTSAGVASYAANIGWRDVPLRDLLAADSGLPVTLGRDAHAAGFAEQAIGAAAGCPDCLIVVIGTGIAGLVVSGGTAVTGARGLAGEIGHLPVWPDGERCACGQRGCLETYASAAAIARRYAAAAGRDVTAAAGRDVTAAAGRNAVTAREVATLRGRGDELASRVWQEAVDALGLALGSATMLTDPGVIVLGGGLAAAGDALLVPVRAALAARLTWREPPRVGLTALGPRAGCAGAAILAWRSIGLDDFSSWVPARPGLGRAGLIGPGPYRTTR